MGAEDKVGDEVEKGVEDRREDSEWAYRVGCTSIAFNSDSMFVPRYSWPAGFDCDCDCVSEVEAVL